MLVAPVRSRVIERPSRTFDIAVSRPILATRDESGKNPVSDWTYGKLEGVFGPSPCPDRLFGSEPIETSNAHPNRGGCVSSPTEAPEAIQ